MVVDTVAVMATTTITTSTSPNGPLVTSTDLVLNTDLEAADMEEDTGESSKTNTNRINEIGS